MMLRLLAKPRHVASLVLAVAALQACATDSSAPPPGASSQGCWTYAQSWRGGGSPAQQPAPVQRWTNDPKACGKVQAQSN
jgi:hypothetical protein